MSQERNVITQFILKLALGEDPIDLPTEMSSHIDSITNFSVKNFILRHLKSTATSYDKIFCNIYPTGAWKTVNHDPNKLNHRPFPDYSPLALFFMHASLDAQNEITDLLLSLDPKETAHLLSVSSAKSRINSRQVFNFCTLENRRKFYFFLKSLTPSQIKLILSVNKQYPINKRDDIETRLTPKLDLEAINLFHYCNFSDEVSSVDFLETLGNLEKEDLTEILGIIAEEPFYVKAKAIFLSPLSERTAMALLGLLEKLDDALLATVFYDTRLFERSDDNNLLHLIFKDYPTRVIEKTIAILSRLPERKIASLLCAIKTAKTPPVYPQSPLSIAFHREDMPDISVRIVRALEKSPKLFALLKEGGLSDTPEEVAIKKNNLPAIICLLEKTPPKTNSESIKKGLLLARKYLNEAMIALYEAKPILDALLHPAKDNSFRELAPRLKSFPAICHTSWSQQKTLLHLATICKNTEAITALLKAGSCPNRPDEQGLTPFHEALASRDKAIIRLFMEHDSTNASLPTKEGTLPLEQVLALSDYSLTTTMLSRLTTKTQNEPACHSFASVLSHFPQTYFRMNAIEGILDTAPTGQLIEESLRSCCDQSQDILGVFLVKSSRLFAQGSPDELRTAAKQFLEQQLVSLSSDAHSPQIKEIVRLRIILFLWAMPTHKMVDLLKTCQFNSDTHLQLELILCKALVKPLIYQTLSHEEQRAIFSLFSPQSNSLTSLIHVHFQSSVLLNMPTALLHDFANTLSPLVLFQHSQTRPIPTLILLALQKMLSEDPIDQDSIEQLTTQLHAKLGEFNEDASELSILELRQLLDITKHPQTKKIINDFFSQHPLNAPILQKIEALFLSTKKNLMICNEGLLHDLLINLASDSDTMSQKEAYPPVLAELMPALSPEQCQHLLTTHKPQAPYNDTKKTTFQRVSNALLDGLLHHQKPAANAYVLPFLQEQLKGSELISWGGLYRQLPTFLAQHSVEKTELFATILTPMLMKIETLTFLLEDIHDIANRACKEEHIIALFTNLEKDERNNFVAFTKASGFLDLSQLARSVSQADENPEQPIIIPDDAKLWLMEQWKAITYYHTSLLSLSVLILAHQNDVSSVIPSLDDVSMLMNKYPHELQPEAIALFISSYQALLGTKETMHAFMRSLNAIMKPATQTTKIQILDSLPPNVLESILEHVLSGLHANDEELEQICYFLMLTIGQHQVSLRPELQRLIKGRLCRQDLSLVGDSQLSLLAESVLSDKSRFDDITIDGVWIQRLLTSVHFMAASTPTGIHRLVERYRAITLTLKHDELDSLNRWLTKKIPSHAQQKQMLKQIQEDLLAHPDKKLPLLAKRQQLLQAFSDDSIRALFNQLEDDCLDLQEDDYQDNVTLAQKALNAFYAYHATHFSNMRGDRLFRLANFLYSKTVAGHGDLEVSQNRLLRWLEKYLPHHNFQQSELMRKRDTVLFNTHRKEIGYLDESHQVLTLIDGQVVALINSPDTRNMPLFNHNHQRVGTLSATGHLEIENLFRNDTVAMLVAKVPIEELTRSETGLALLLSDIVREQSLDATYACPEAAIGSEKRIWLEHEISRSLAKTKHPISEKMLFSCLDHHTDENLFKLLATMEDSDNAYRLFEALLFDPNKQTHLFKQTYQKELNSFLNRHDAKKILAHYLDRHDKPWFDKGLKLFATFASETNKPNLLGDALVLFAQNTAEDTLLDGLLNRLIGTENNCQLMLQFLSDDDTKKPVQEIKSKHLANLSGFFDKCHVSHAIKEQNKQSLFRKNAQQRFLMHIFHRQKTRLFPRQENRLSKRSAWQADDLLELTTFFQRHIAYKTPNDKEGAIANRLLPELVFRAANFGQISLFYKSNPAILDDAISIRSLNRRDTDESAPSHHDLKKLKEVEIIDWGNLAKTMWESYGKDNIPLIIAFLTHYIGDAKPLKDLIIKLQQVRAIRPMLCELMEKYPDRDVSALIFQSLEENIQTTPNTLNAEFFSHLSSYYHQSHGNIKEDASTQILSLLKYFGQQGKYDLVQQSCHVLCSQFKKDKPFLSLLKKIQTEAIIEAELSVHKDRWYFSILRFLKRAWHYDGKPSGIVTFCDDPDGFKRGIEEITTITSTVSGGQQMKGLLKIADNQKKLREIKEKLLSSEKTQSDSQLRFFMPTEEADKVLIGACPAL